MEIMGIFMVFKMMMTKLTNKLKKCYFHQFQKRNHFILSFVYLKNYLYIVYNTNGVIAVDQLTDDYLNTSGKTTGLFQNIPNESTNINSQHSFVEINEFGFKTKEVMVEMFVVGKKHL